MLRVDLGWRNQAGLHQIHCFLIGHPEVVFFFPFDVFHPSVANLLAGKEGSLVLERKTSPEITELLPALEMADIKRTLPVLVLPNI